MSHTHTSKEDKIMQEAERITKQLKNAETLKIQSETQLDTLRTQYKKVEGEVEQMGVDPKKAEEALNQIDKEMAELLAEIQQLLPTA